MRVTEIRPGEGEPRRALVLTYGTRGDVEPFLALAKGLQAAGFSVLFATSVRFAGFVKAHGVPFFGLADASLAAIDSADGRTMMEGGAGPLARLAAGLRLARRAGPVNEALFAECCTAADAARPDIIVHHAKLFAAPHIAEARGIPAVLGTLQPVIVPTRAFPPMGLPAVPLPGANRLAYSLVTASFGAFRGAINRLRRDSLGLPPIRRRREIPFPPGAGAIPVLHAYSPHVLPRPDDWPPQAHVTGYWRLPSEDALPNAVTRFLADGPPPVFLGFGSMTSGDPDGLARILAEALRRAGRRGILARGWADLALPPSPDILTIPPVPYAALFPRMAAVVHHGGAGTTAEAFHAGVPQVICPFFGDQPGWARRAAELGVAVPPLPRRRLDPARLAAAITAATTTPALRHAATRLAADLAGEDGVAIAVSHIAATLAR